MNNRNVKICIIVVSWNTADALRDCLLSIFKNITTLTFHIIVVDNASDDDSTRVVEDEFPSVELVKNKENIGFGGAINQVAGRIIADYIFLLNSDAKLVGDDLSRLIAIMDSDHTIGIATGKMYNIQGDPTPGYFAFPSLFYLLKAHTINLVRKYGAGIRGKARKCCHTQNEIQICDVDWVSGGYLIIRRELIGSGPMFDPRLFMYYEDALLCRSVWSMGRRVVYVALADVYHEQGKSSKQRQNKSLLTSFKSSRVYVQEVYGRQYLKLYDLLVRGSWVFIKSMMQLLCYFGFTNKAGKKVKQFQYLIENTQQL
jgi:GT2 family glycosyltransferase